MKTYEEIIALADNKTANDISVAYKLLRQSAFQYIKRKVKELGTDGVLKCDIIIDTPESQGLSDLLKPCITEIKSYDNDDIIFYWEDTGEIDFQYTDTDWLMQIVENLDELC